MQLCGVGDIPRDCGVEDSARQLQPEARPGVPRRPRRSSSAAAIGINYDPQPLAFIRNLLGVYPQSLGYGLPAPANANVPAGRLRDGLPPGAERRIRAAASSTSRSTTGFFSPPDEYKMGYIQSWNLTFEKRLIWGFIGQAGYVGSRQKDILQTLDLNAGQIPGAGRDGQPLFQKFGRTADSNIIGNFGEQLVRFAADDPGSRVRQRRAVQRRVHLVESDGAVLRRPERQEPGDPDSGVHAPEQIAEAATTARTSSRSRPLPSCRSATGKRFASSGVAAKIAGRLADQRAGRAYSGTPFSVSSSGTSLNAPGNTQRADQVKSDVQILGGTGRGQSYFDPLAFAPVTEARFGTAGFNTVRGPGHANLDLALVRNFRIGRRYQFQLRPKR